MPTVDILLMTARPDLETNRRLVAAGERRGVELRVVDATRACAVAGTRQSLWYEDEDLLAEPPKAVLARVGNWRPESLLAALEVVSAAGVPTPNPAPSVRAGRDHWQTIRRLAEAGLPVPETIAGADPESLAATAESRLGLPVVVKERQSRMGVGVIRCSGRDHLESVLDSLWRVGNEVVVQRYVPTGGRSLRLLVVGGRVVAAVKLEAREGEWRSNASRGGAAQTHEPTRRERALATAAARSMSLGLCGVDLLPGPDGPVVGEVNPTPGFRHLERATGIDVAGAIVALLVGA